MCLLSTTAQYSQKMVWDALKLELQGLKATWYRYWEPSLGSQQEHSSVSLLFSASIQLYLKAGSHYAAQTSLSLMGYIDPPASAY